MNPGSFSGAGGPGDPAAKPTDPVQATRVISAHLRAGRIDVEIDPGAVAPETLFGLAERQNPKRPFLFVSRVLGRHIPAAPSMMRAAAEQLAVKLPRHLPGPVLIIGVAETALCLGAAVHRAFVQARGRSDAVFLASTRHALETPLLVSLQEEHGHALPHRLHRPIDPETLRLVRGARSLILVDNEMSTGQTFVNLANALATAGLNDARRIVLAVLTDWSDGRAVAALGPTATTASLLAGRYRWTPRPGGTMLPEVPRPVSAPPTAPWPLDSRKDWGRLGRRDVKPRLFAEARKGERLLIVGTGEYVWEPFLLAESLEAQGADVLVSAATRSPIAPGHSIGRAFAFQDNYGEGIANYLYNVDPAAFDRILLCTEMPARLLDPAFIAALGAPEILSSADAS